MDRKELETHITEGLVNHTTFLATALKTAQGSASRDGEGIGLPGEDGSPVAVLISTQLSSVKTELESNFTKEIKRKDTEIAQLKIQITNLEKKMQAKEAEQVFVFHSLRMSAMMAQ